MGAFQERDQPLLSHPFQFSILVSYLSSASHGNSYTSPLVHLYSCFQTSNKVIPKLILWAIKFFQVDAFQIDFSSTIKTQVSSILQKQAQLWDGLPFSFWFSLSFIIFFNENKISEKEKGLQKGCCWRRRPSAWFKEVNCFGKEILRWSSQVVTHLGRGNSNQLATQWLDMEQAAFSTFVRMWVNVIFRVKIWSLQRSSYNE